MLPGREFHLIGYLGAVVRVLVGFSPSDALHL